ncbi:MAG: hypothetical protein Q6373_024490, partial [Candidatus Sigynarchaeota archaeon]
TLDEIFSQNTLTSLRKGEIATIIGTPDQYVILCRHHQMILVNYFFDHPGDEPGERFEAGMLQVIDRDTEEHEDEREEGMHA